MPAASLVVSIVLTIGPHSSGTAWLVQTKPGRPPRRRPRRPSRRRRRSTRCWRLSRSTGSAAGADAALDGNPAEVQELSGWLVRNTELTGTALQNARRSRVRAKLVVLALFPQVVNYMADNIAWTRSLGKAFTTDREGVLRQRPAAACGGQGPRAR